MAVSDTAHDAVRHYHMPSAAIVAGLAALAAVLHGVTPLNHDEAYFIEGAGRLLSGGRFGRDIADINPPLVWWMSEVPVWFARQLGARVEWTAAIFTAALAALSLVAVERQIARDSALRPQRHALITIAAILLLFAPGYDFGQREHWMVVMTLPYVVARSRRADGAKLSTVAGIVIGFAAGLGFVSNLICCWRPSARKSGCWRERGGHGFRFAPRPSPWRRPACSISASRWFMRRIFCDTKRPMRCSACGRITARCRKSCRRPASRSRRRQHLRCSVFSRAVPASQSRHLRTAWRLPARPVSWPRCCR